MLGWIAGKVEVFYPTQHVLKCAGAPLKMTLLPYRALKRPEPNAFKVEFLPLQRPCFSVPLYNPFVVERWQQQGVDLHHSRILKAMDVAAKKAYFQQEDGSLVEEAYDFIHVVPRCQRRRRS